MTRSDAIIRYAKGAAAPLASGPLESPLILSAETAAEAVAVTLLDTFDAQLAGAGHLLLSTSDALILIGDEAPLEQPWAAPGLLAQMPTGPVTARLSRIVSPLRALMPVASGTARLTRLRVLDDNEKTQARGTVWVLTTDAGKAVSFTAVTALRGYDKALHSLRGQMDRAGVIDALQAAARLRGEDVKAFGKTPIAMAPDEDAFDAATAIIRAQLAMARRTEAGIVADIDTEFLHDYRVALRRVRSVVSLFKGVFSEAQTQTLKDRFGALMARTGRLRDLDVYLLERDAYIALVPETRRAGIARLFDRFAAERTAEQAKLAGWLQTKVYDQDIKRLMRLFEQTRRLERGPEAGRHALDYARMLIWKRYRKVCKLAAGIDTAPDEQVHELRIHCKKLRYLMEFFAPLFDADEVRGLIKSLKRLQDNLGNFNDYSVQQVALEQAAAGVAAEPGPDAVDIATGIGALIMVLNQRQHEERGRVAASFAAFDSDETRGEFRTLFKPGKEAQ